MWLSVHKMGGKAYVRRIYKVRSTGAKVLLSFSDKAEHKALKCIHYKTFYKQLLLHIYK